MKIKTHKEICEQIHSAYKAQNVLLLYLYDKVEELETLMGGSVQNVYDESIGDILLDIANCAVVALVKRKTGVVSKKEICEQMHTVYKAKNADYGDSFSKLREKFPNAILIRLHDKLNRLETLMNGNSQQVNDESIDDTLLDLANYAVMELVERKMETPKMDARCKRLMILDIENPLFGYGDDCDKRKWMRLLKELKEGVK